MGIGDHRGPAAARQAALEEAFQALTEERDTFLQTWLSGKQLKHTTAAKILDGAGFGMGVKAPGTLAAGGVAKLAGVVKSHLPSGGSSSSSSSGVLSSIRGGAAGAAGFLGSHIKGAGSQVGHAVSGVASRVPLRQAGSQVANAASHLPTAPLMTAQRCAREMLERMFDEIPGVPLADFLSEFPGLLGEITSHITPFIGPAADTAKAAKAFGHVGFAIYRDVRARRKSVRLALNGDANAALAGLKTLLDRQIVKHAYAAGRSSITAASKTGLAVLDAGALSGSIVGAAAAIADLAFMITCIIIEWREAKAGNKILASGKPIDATIFEVCPLLGCYILTCSTRSNVLNWLVEDMGSDNWMDDVERMNKAITPILAIASQRIADARYELPLPGGVNMPKVYTGQVIRADDGDILIKLERLKQKGVTKVKNAVTAPKTTWKEYKLRRRTRQKIRDQAI